MESKMTFKRCSYFTKSWTLTRRRPSRRMLRSLICGILLICMTALLNLTTRFVAWSPLKQDLNLNSNREKLSDLQLLNLGTRFDAWSPLKQDLNLNSNREKLSDLQLLEPSEFDDQPDVQCINATVGAMHFPMCIYDPQQDIYISAAAAAGGCFEQDLVKKWIDFFRIHPYVSFVDIGANLGIYTLPIAHLHSGIIHVVSVEPNRDTVRRLAKSVRLGRIENNVAILHYALSREETTTFLNYNDVNRGDTFMVSNASGPGCLSANVTVLNKLIPFIRHKQAVLKVDVQGAEIEIFQRKSAAKFFEEIDVVMVQIEWNQYSENYGQAEDRRRRVDRFLEFFYQRGYDVYDPKTEAVLDADWIKWPFDVLFKKEELPKNQLFLI